MTDRIEELRQRLAELVDLRNAAQVLSWDQQTMMPPRGAPARAEALATLERISHEMFVSPDTGRLLDAAAAELNGASDQSPMTLRWCASRAATGRRHDASRPTSPRIWPAQGRSDRRSGWRRARTPTSRCLRRT